MSSSDDMIDSMQTFSIINEVFSIICVLSPRLFCLLRELLLKEIPHIQIPQLLCAVSYFVELYLFSFVKLLLFNCERYTLSYTWSNFKIEGKEVN